MASPLAFDRPYPLRSRPARALTRLGPAVAACALFASAAGAAPRAHDGTGGFPPQFEGVDVPGLLVNPVDLVFADDGDLYVAEKIGRVYVYEDEVLQPSPVLDIRPLVNYQGDRGLLGIALHPGFVPDGGERAWLYAFYTRTPVEGQALGYDEDDKYSHGMLVRYSVDRVGGALVADADQAHVLLGERLPDGSAPDAFASLHTSHAQGALVFGADGTLLVGHGEGAHHNFPDFGGNNDPGFDDWIHPLTGLRGQIPKEQDSGAFRSQDLRSLSGKVLRIDPATGAGLPSNPFFDGDPTSNASRVWALGLRNPYRMALVPGTGATDPALGDPGTLLVGEVGYWRFEELLWLDAPGLNFGWPCMEGDVPTSEFTSYVAPDPNPFAYFDCGTPQYGIPTAAMVGYHHFDSLQSFPPGIYFDDQGQAQPGLLGACVIGGAVYPGGSYPPEYAGRLFFGDYSGNYIKTLEFDAAGNPVAVRDFAAGVDRLTDIAAHPLTGDLYYLEMGNSWGQGHVIHLRYGENLSPAAMLAVDAPTGAAPHAVQLDASASTDPEGQALTYRFDFDDGTAPLETTVPSAAHTYSSSGVFHPSVRVTDPGGLFDVATTTVAVDSVPPVVAIVTPSTGTLFDDDTTALEVAGTASSAPGTPLTIDWQVDLHHNVHVHPGFFSDSSSGGTSPVATSTVVPIDPHGDGPEVIFYEVLLTATDPAGASASASAWYYPAGELLDPVGTAQLVARVDELDPPGSQGFGNPDREVIRDGVEPPVGSSTGPYFDTFHFGDQGADDWIGMVLTSRPEPYARFVSLTFVEGPHFADGGWFDDLTVEVLTGGVWAPVDDLVLTPPYPAGDPGVGYERFEFDFAPRYGEGIRLRGTPGGSAGYVTCAELRAGLVTTEALQTQHRDLSDEGSLQILVDQLDPPGSQGFGNPDAELLRNGTLPAAGSTSEWAQYATFHGGGKGGGDWLGYRFDEPQTLTSLLFQEGLHFANGGWFESLRVESRVDHDGPWQPVPLLQVDPPFRGGAQGGQTYETFTFEFEPLVARGVRLVGVPGGVDEFVTAAELRVYGPWFDDDHCGASVYGDFALFGVAMAIDSNTPPLLGHPLLVEVTDAEQPEPAPGAMLIGLASTFVDFGAGTLLVDPAGGTFSPLAFDAAGEADWFATLPSDPSLSGLTVYLQAGRYSTTHPGGVRYSQGLALTLCQ